MADAAPPDDVAFGIALADFGAKAFRCEKLRLSSLEQASGHDIVRLLATDGALLVARSDGGVLHCAMEGGDPSRDVPPDCLARPLRHTATWPLPPGAGLPSALVGGAPALEATAIVGTAAGWLVRRPRPRAARRH
ncbi:unnamed protein product [Prorocentrum cordatum]|uniref:Anaphase-promoting complex subunit 1 n=1 Tax=Prorocentrum cordatum TaxID=2364126 RepID=A0ABN9Q866_9DINO|nr:unnamed protein product [Polarella glacialis]